MASFFGLVTVCETQVGLNFKGGNQHGFYKRGFFVLPFRDKLNHLMCCGEEFKALMSARQPLYPDIIDMGDASKMAAL